MEVTNKNGEAREIDSQIVYNLRQAANPNDPYHEMKKRAGNRRRRRGKAKRIGSLYLRKRQETAFTGTCPITRPTGEVIRHQVITSWMNWRYYVDNDKDGNYDTKTDKVWDELWVSYADKNGKIVSKKVTRETRYELCTYYAFGKGSGLTELSLLAISNGELNEKGGF